MTPEHFQYLLNGLRQHPNPHKRLAHLEERYGKTEWLERLKKGLTGKLQPEPEPEIVDDPIPLPAHTPTPNTHMPESAQPQPPSRKNAMDGDRERFRKASEIYSQALQHFQNWTSADSGSDNEEPRLDTTPDQELEWADLLNYEPHPRESRGPEVFDDLEPTDGGLDDSYNLDSPPMEAAVASPPEPKAVPTTLRPTEPAPVSPPKKRALAALSEARTRLGPR